MPVPHSEARSGLDVLLQSIDLEVAAEERVSPAPTSECTTTWPGSSARRSRLALAAIRRLGVVPTEFVGESVGLSRSRIWLPGAFGPGFERERPRQVGAA